MYSKPPQSLKIHFGRTKLPTLATVFFFSRQAGQDSFDNSTFCTLQNYIKNPMRYRKRNNANLIICFFKDCA